MERSRTARINKRAPDPSLPSHPQITWPVHCLRSHRYQPGISLRGKLRPVQDAQLPLSRRLGLAAMALEAILDPAIYQIGHRIVCRPVLMFRFQTITTSPELLSAEMVENPEILVRQGSRESRGTLESSVILETPGILGILVMAGKPLKHHEIHEITGLGLRRDWIVLESLSDARRKDLETPAAPTLRQDMPHARTEMLRRLTHPNAQPRVPQDRRLLVRKGLSRQ